MNIFRQISAQWAAVLFVGIISFFTTLFIARWIGPASFGQFVNALTVGLCFVVFLDGGYKTLITRNSLDSQFRVSLSREELFKKSLGHQFLVAVTIILICITFFPSYLFTVLALVFCFSNVVVSQQISARLRGQGRLQVDATWQVLQRSASAVCIFGCVILGFHQPWHIFIAWGLGNLTANVLAPFGFYFSFSRILDQQLYRTLAPFFWIEFMTVIYFRSDMLMLKLFNISNGEIGYYASSFRLVEAFILLSNPIALIFFRRFRIMSLTGEPILRSFFALCIFAILGGLLLGYFVNFFDYELLRFTFGGKYIEGQATLKVLAWALVFILPNAILTQVSLAIGAERLFAIMASACALFNILFNWFFIPQYGTLAASVGTLLTEALLTLGLGALLCDRLLRKSRSSDGS